VLLRASAGASPFAPPLPAAEPFAIAPARLAAGAEPAVPLAAAFRNGWTCLGYSLEDGPTGPVLTTYWQVGAGYVPPAPRPVAVLSGTPLPLRFFAHVLAADGSVLAGDDRLDLDPATLRPGDSFVQRFEFAVESAPSGTYPVQVGVYDPATGARVPLEGGLEALRLTEVSLP
jgi:hypothetical protein